MVNIVISPTTAEKLQELSNQSGKTVDELLTIFLEEYQVIQKESALVEEGVWTAEEIAEMLQPKTPLTGKEIVALGLLGGWADMEIEDSVEWLQRQRAKRRKKLNLTPQAIS